MIDHERRAVFIHIPKTAGMSIYEAFSIQNQWGHLRLADHPEHPLDYFSFAIVRNPWERTLSTWLYLQKGGRGNAPDLAAQAAVCDCESFDQFACNLPEYRRRLAEIPAPGWGIPLTGGDINDRRYPHLLPQTTWTHDSKGIEVLDFLGRFERLELDLAHVGRVLNTQLPLGHHNSTSHGDYRRYYRRRSRKAVAREFEADLDLLGYRW